MFGNVIDVLLVSVSLTSGVFIFEPMSQLFSSIFNVHLEPISKKNFMEIFIFGKPQPNKKIASANFSRFRDNFNSFMT